jgi:hypothetical protein
MDFRSQKRPFFHGVYVTYKSHKKKVRKYHLLRSLPRIITTASSGGKNMKREEKKTFDQIRFVTDYKRDGLMKDYLKGIVYEGLKIHFYGPYEVKYDLTLPKLEESTLKMVHQCGFRDLKIGKVVKTIIVTD